jgi:hypothetical protein
VAYDPLSHPSTTALVTPAIVRPGQTEIGVIAMVREVRVKVLVLAQA